MTEASKPTTPSLVDVFIERYAAFRLELDAPEMEAFDRLAQRVRRYEHALAHRPMADFERPIMLTMVMEAAKEQGTLRARADRLAHDVDDACRQLAAADVIRLRPTTPSRADLARMGQVRLPKGPSVGNEARDLNEATATSTGHGRQELPAMASIDNVGPPIPR